MRGIFKSLFLLGLSVAVCSTVHAQKDVTYELRSPEVVAVGEVFRIEFTSNTQPKSFRAPDFGGLDILAGPTSSTSKFSSVSGGNMIQETKYSYVYVLQAAAEGEYTISESSVEIGRDSYKTKPITIRAIREPDRDESQQGQVTVAPDDIILRAEVDKTSAFKGEPVRVTYKILYRVPVTGLENRRMPSFNGFWTQQLNNKHGIQREEYKGKIYDTQVLAEYLIYPQQSGKLVVDPMEATAVARLVTERKRQSILDDFFGGLPEVQDIRRNVGTDQITINVRELPLGAPASFSGAVGEFEMAAEPFETEITANSAVTYTLRITGSGNLPQVHAPKLQLPASFEQYNVKTTESLNTNARGINGYRQFEYPFIARVEGDYEIAPVEFTYFSPARLDYVTLRAPQLRIRVQPDNTPRQSTGGIVSGLSKEDVKMLGQDIRFIKIGQANLRPKGSFLVGSWQYFLIIAAIAGLFAFLLVTLRKSLAARRNAALLKGKRANKVALQRFRCAENYMKTGNRVGFYEEMLKALWGYMSDKLNIPVANLTKENIRDELVKKGVSPELASRYVAIIGECEYAQYAPAVSGEMHVAYSSGVELISKLESVLGK